MDINNIPVKTVGDRLRNEELNAIVDQIKKNVVDIDRIEITGPASMGGVVPNTAFVPEMGNVGNPAIYFAGPGVYPGFGGITLTEPLNVISWDSVSAVVKGVPIEVPEPDLSGLVTKVEFEKVNAFSDSFIRGKNLIDKTGLVAGYIGTSGTFVASVNHISTDFISLEEAGLVTGDKITLYGKRAFSAAINVFHFFDANKVRISQVAGNAQGNQTATIPENTKYIVMLIDNATNVAADIPNSPFYNTVMLVKGEAVLPYEKYGYRIPKSSVDGVDQEFTAVATSIQAVDAKVQLNSDSIGLLMQDYEEFSRFDGVTSEIPLSTTFVLNNAGDYVEFEFRMGNQSTNLHGLGMFGSRSVGTRDIFGTSGNKAMWLRQHTTNSAYVQFQLDTIADFTEFTKVKLQVSGDGLFWDLYIDDSLAQSKAKTDSLYISNIGYAYDRRAVFDLKFVNIYTAENQLQIPKPAAYPTAIGIELKYEKKKSELNAVMSPVYVSYDPTGYNGRERIVFYVRRGTSNNYIGHHVLHEYDMSDEIYSDQFRIVKADEYLFDGVSAMVKISEKTIEVGESECVYRHIAGKVDFTGGVHGDETFDSFKLYVDGIDKTLSEKFDLLPCSVAWYEQESKMHETMNSDETPITGHPVEVLHYKKTVFKDSYYETVNRLIPQKIMNIFWYLGICCLGKVQATYAYDQEYEVIHMTGSGSEMFRKLGSTLIEFYNPETNLSAKIFTVNDSFPLSECRNFVADRPIDSKYYLRSPDFETVIDKTYQSIMKVTYS